MKQVAGKIKLELAQFDDLQAFAQFASDLDKATQDQLAGSRSAGTAKAAQYSPLAVYEQVAILYAGINGLLDDIAVEKLAVSRRDWQYLKPASRSTGS